MNDPACTEELRLWLDENKHRRLIATRIEGHWKVQLVTHGPLYAEGKGRTFDEAIEDALDDMGQRDTSTVAGAAGAR